MLSNLQLVNFRSYTDRTFQFSPGITLITGPNGSGKTNVLEALYLLGMTRSWRAGSRELVRLDSDWFRVVAVNNSQTHSLAWNGAKQFALNGKAQKPHQIVGSLPIVLFEPGSLQIAAGSPQARRAFLDNTLAQGNKEYLRLLVRYRRALRQRNLLLRRIANDPELFAWDMILAQAAEYLVHCRRQMVATLAENITELYRQLSSSNDVVTLSYETSVNSPEYVAALLKELQARTARDRRLGFTSVGPHRDELAISYNRRPLQQIASQGELRTVVLVLKLLQLDFLKQYSATLPLLLLDDVFSELDISRQQQLLGYIKDSQTIMTTTVAPPNLSASEIAL